MIKGPKGTVGCSGFSLMAEMKLDKKNPKDRTLYCDIMVSFCPIVNTEHLQWSYHIRLQFAKSPSPLELISA
jgi:hypothetical protein